MDNNTPIPNWKNLNFTSECLLNDLCDDIEKHHDLHSGTTALYHHLKSIISSHIKE